MAQDIIAELLNNPLAMGIGVIVIAIVIYFYMNRPQKEKPHGRKILIDEIKHDNNQTMKVLGHSPKDSELWQGHVYIGSIKKMAIKPAQKIATIKIKNKETNEIENKELLEATNDKIKKVYIYFLYKDWRVLGIPIGKFMANYFNDTFTLIADSDSILEHRNEDTEMLRSALAFDGLKTNNFQVFRLKPDAFVETHLGITIVNSKIVQEYMRSINWKILHEEATGEYTQTPRRFAYFDKNIAGKVEIEGASADIQDKMKEKQTKRYVGA